METLSSGTDAVLLNVVSPPPVCLEDVVISDHLLSRPTHTLPARAEIDAMYELAGLLAEGAPQVLKRLAQMAVDLCNAGSGGISMLEIGAEQEELFRWRALAGELEKYEGGSTPREWSPCGQCLKAGKPMLYSHPARFFTYFQQVDLPIVEGLVIPMYADKQAIGTIWVISHDERRRFDAEDVRIMTSLGSFVSAATRVPFAARANRSEKEHSGPGVVWGELVRRIAGGDTGALAALIDETKPVVFGRALRLLSLRADAEEVTMDVYSHVWRIAGSYNADRGAVLSWLLSIAGSRAIDLLRSRARHQRSFDALCLECSGGAELEDLAASRETGRKVHQALQALPLSQRQAIQLVYFCGYSLTQVAARLGLPLGTVKSRLRYGVMKLRLLLAATEIHRPY